MRKFRILVVDDAVVFRRMVAEEIGKDPSLEVAGTASNGRIALAKIPQLNPDLVILDVEMPEMDGLTTLAELRRMYPRLPVIMFSALTERGAEATLDALALGATDYFTKPSGDNGMAGSLEVIRDRLVPEIRAVCQQAATQESVAAQANAKSTGAAGGPTAGPSGKSSAMMPALGRLTSKVEIVAIGCSTGGPNALADVFATLPGDLPVPIVIVQHMPPMFTRLLAERLSARFAIRVHEASSGCLLEPGQAWIAPGDHHMTVVRDANQTRLLLNQDPPENSCRPAVNVLLRSMADCYGRNSLTVILTGMGQDGLRGCEAIRGVGGQVVAQDEATSVVWGMPGFVVRAGLADRVVPLPLIGKEIVRRIRCGPA